MELLIYLSLSFIFISVSGVLLHFAKVWFKKGFLANLVSAVNESTWEHMKLAYFPTLITIIIQYFIFGKDYANFWSTSLITLILGTFLIPVIYYLLIKTIIKKDLHFVNIFLYFYCVLIAIFAEYILLYENIVLFSEMISIIGTVVITIPFLIFTYFPPKIFLFKDPVQGKYGIPNIGK